MKPILGILLGEATGIGPELIARLCALDKLRPYCRPLLIGDLRVLNLGKKIAGVDFEITVIDDISEVNWEGPIPMLDQRNLDPADITLGKIDPFSGRISGDMLVAALDLTQRGAIRGFVYGPLHKAALKYGGYNFEDEQLLMAHLLGWQGLRGEMNVLNNLWTSRVTSHIPLKEVSNQLTEEAILGAIRLTHETLKKAGYKRPCIAVAALNPHGGENGLCGREEIDLIAPTIKLAEEAGINVLGPYPADTVFINAFKGNYDAVVTMYHDQGQIAMKLMGFQFGVTVAAGLPYPITTPAHGTAYDIVGKGIAKWEAMEQAVIIAAKMAGGCPK